MSFARFASTWNDGTDESAEKHQRRLEAYFDAEAESYYKDVVLPDKSNLAGLIQEFLFARHEEGEEFWEEP
jgi:hypothetical protein